MRKRNLFQLPSENPDFPANSMAPPPLSQENSFSFPNFPGIFRNHPRCRYLCVSTACILLYLLYTLTSVFISAQLLFNLELQRDFDAPRRVTLHSSRVFHSPEAFELDYEKMEKELKVFVYPDGDPETYFHTPRKLTGKYSSEGYFFKNIKESRFFTADPLQAHLFFIPISCHKMRGKGLTYELMIYEVGKYVESLKFKYPYWNRTLGADHFFVTCHDIGAKATNGVPYLVKNSIRVVCSSSYDGLFIPHKDVTLPQVQLPFLHPAGGNDIKRRKILAFWAGRSDSKLKDELAAVWDNDTELDIQNNRIDRHATGSIVYLEKLYRSKFCLCPHGPVGSSRIADSIHYGCVPVIMSNYYDLPFNEILDWRKFSVVVKESDLYQLKDILRNISEKDFVTLNQNLVKVQKHFQWNTPPVRLDAFHMVMYELWLRRHLTRYF
ncbi:probable glycosyltransferase At5g03795 isoform X1 [Arachis stenosperma]|uniref:probable glycosyltransferase At5g03795 isoform X1 n=1 Tax=Arachis stenosperma TaxID=217475 RepID=UPI0025ABD0C6|nr:probable glycosyltransferase At5g03795 isoform X1 [Arachis stenosperma]